VTIRCATNATYTNMKVMLNEGDHALPYQPYEGPVTHDGSLAAVAKSGEYSDLTGKPALFSGSYNDLTNKPTIPSIPSITISTSPSGGNLVTDLTSSGHTVTQDKAVSYSTAATSGTIVQRDGNGYINAVLFNTSCGQDNLTPTSVYFEYNNDGYIRKMSWANFLTKLSASLFTYSNGVLTINY
jgi:hypothetical protein